MDAINNIKLLTFSNEIYVIYFQRMLHSSFKHLESRNNISYELVAVAIYKEVLVNYVRNAYFKFCVQKSEAHAQCMKLDSGTFTT